MAIIKKTDVAPERPVSIVIFGSAGVGKTSMANTANEPVNIDTDRGFDRACNRVDTIVASKWEDILESEGEIKNYKTAIVDTAKGMLDDFLIEYVTRQDYKLKNNKQKMYGEIGDQFKAFVNRRRAEGVDLIFIAHAKEKEVKDNTYYFPDITGGSKDLLIRIADQIGYVSVINGKRVLSFDPTDTVVGKNTAKIPPIEIPDQYDAEFPNFMNGIIERVKKAITSQTEDQKKALEEVASLREKISSIKDTKDADSVLSELNGKPKTMAMPLKEALSEKVKELGFKYNKEAKKFELAQK